MVRWVAGWFLRLNGWQAEGEQPRERRYVLIGAPHTSNWDLVYVIALAAMYDLRVSWMGKHTLFRPPFGWLMRRLGGIPVDRRQPGNLVAQLAQAFEASDSLKLVVPVEGTRGRVSYWKSGFYHIARTANVPIALCFLDYARRRGGFGPVLHPSGDILGDMDRIRDFYRDKTGKHPELFGEVRLREEDQDPSAPTGDPPPGDPA
jgi:1-acyl-sn-glycerol-3-phosphate acyltransferase